MQILENYLADIRELYPLPDPGPGGVPVYGIRYHEVESRTQWEGGPWKWPDISIPLRKKKLIDDVSIRPLSFWCLSASNREAFTIDSSLISDAYLTPRWVQGREEWFYCVPISLWEHVVLKGVGGHRKRKG